MSGNGNGERKIVPAGLETQMEMFVEEGFDQHTQRKCPVSRMPDGRRALFRRDHHRYIRPGDTWLVRVEEDRQNCVFVVPVKRISVSCLDESAAVGRRLPSSVTSLFVSTLEGQIITERQRIEKLRAEMAPVNELREGLLAEKQKLETKLHEISQDLLAAERKLDGLTEDVERAADKVDEYETALSSMSKEPEEVTLEELEHAFEAAPEDYWEEKTRRDRDKNLEML